MRFEKIILGLFIATLMFACETNEIDLVDDNVTLSESESMARGIGNAPEQSGPYLFRGDDIGAFLYVDVEKGISVTLAIDHVAFCNGDPVGSLTPIQFIDVPSNELRAILLAQADLYTEVFDDAYVGGDLCDFFTNTLILAKGMSQFVYTDNDVFGTGGNNTNIWGSHFHGQLLNQEGESKNLSGRHHNLWDKKDRETSVTSIRLK